MATIDNSRSVSGVPPAGVVVALDPTGALGEWRGQGKTVIAIPDSTRQIDSMSALRAIVPRVSQKKDVIIGLGLHRRMRTEELSVLAEFTPIQHDPDACVPTAMVDGIPGSVHPLVLEADEVLSVGVVELHQYAGFSGGHKGVAVGCGGRNTILELHRRERVTDSRVRLGRLSGNPFRAAIDQLGRVAGCNLALLYVPNARRWVFGEPSQALHTAASLCHPWKRINVQYDCAVLVIPKAKGRSLYQASRAATYLALSPNPPVRRGGRLILQAELCEGLGTEMGFVQALESCSPPWSQLLDGPPPKGAGAQRAVMLALMARDYRLEICGCTDPERFESLGIPARSERYVPDGSIRIESPFNVLPQYSP